jgi:hypothetical protein
MSVLELPKENKQPVQPPHSTTDQLERQGGGQTKEDNDNYKNIHSRFKVDDEPLWKRI